VKPGIERVQALANISRSALCCHNNETRALIANPANSAQLLISNSAPRTIPPSYIRVRAIVWECGEGRTDTQTHCIQTHAKLKMFKSTPRLLSRKFLQDSPCTYCFSFLKFTMRILSSLPHFTSQLDVKDHIKQNI